MKTVPNSARPVTWTAALAAALLPCHALTLTTPGELQLAADLDGDTRPDLILVDRASGAFRVGYQLAPNAFTWSGARASGLNDVTGADAGRLLSAAQDSLVVASPSGNRLIVLHAPNSAAAALPTPVFPDGIGPAFPIAMDIGGNLNTPRADLAVFSAFNNPPTTWRQDLIRNQDGTFSPLTDLGVDAPAHQASRVRLKTLGADLAGVLVKSGNLARLRIQNLAAGNVVKVAESPALDATAFIHDAFTAGPLHHFLLYRPGQTTLHAVAVQEPNPGTFAFANPVAHPLGYPAGLVTPLEGGPVRRLAIVSEDGASLHLHPFDGTTLGPAQTIPAPAGESFTGVLPTGAGGFKALTSEPGSHQSTRFHDFKFDGSKFTETTSGGLPPVEALATYANVFLYNAEPFVAPNATLLRSLNAADWSRSAAFAGNPVSLAVQAEQFGTTAEGLDNPTARDLGAVPPGATHVLVNQYRPVISVQSFLPAVGDEVADVHILPPAGPQLSAVHLSFTVVPAPAVIHYRLSPGAPWSTYNVGDVIPLFSNATVEFYAALPAPSDAKSRIHSATYTFPSAPGLADSDSDGVPDHVEVEFGLDPTAGPDSDGDGFSDKNELVAGTNPSNANGKIAGNVPTELQRIEESTAFRLFAGPQPVDGTTGNPTTATEDVELSVHTLTGARLAAAKTRNQLVAGVPSPNARFDRIAAEPSTRILSIATELHFPVATAGSDKNLGRELVSLLPLPALPPPVVNYTYSGKTPAQEAAAWVNAAKAAYAGVPTPLVKRTLIPLDALAATLLERKLGQIFESRGKTNLGPTNITLFPFRTPDLTRTAPDSIEIESLATRVDDTHPGWDFGALHGAIATAVAGPHPAPIPVVPLVNAIYRVCSASNNVAPGSFDLPVDVLRGLLGTSNLPPTYASAVGFTPAQIQSVAAYCNGILNTLSPRPTVTLDMVVTENSFGPTCTTLLDAVTLQPRNLWADRGVRFLFPDNFLLIPGTVVRVSAYSDLHDAQCPEPDLQVYAAELVSLPPISLADANGNLLPDDWECLFLGGSGNPDDDLDKDGNTNLQEYFDGTDPKDPLQKNPVKIDPKLSPIEIALKPGNQSELKFNFPAPYANQVKFTIEASDSLDVGFTTVGQPAQKTPGQFSFNLPVGNASQQFFRVRHETVKNAIANVR